MPPHPLQLVATLVKNLVDCRPRRQQVLVENRIDQPAGCNPSTVANNSDPVSELYVRADLDERTVSV